MADGGIPNFCDLPLLAGPKVCDLPDAVKDVAGVAGAVVETAQFMQDPFGYTAGKMQAAAADLADAVLPNLEAVTHPDLNREWFISTYRVSFALALLVFVAFLGWNFVALARRRISGDELIETLGLYVPLFLGGALFGPAIGQLLLSFTGALTNSVTHWGFGGGTTQTSTRLQEIIAAGDPATIAGGAIVSIFLFFAMIIGLLMVFVILIVMLVTLYLTGALLPLSLVWLVHPHRRGRGLKLVSVWLGICFTHVLLFLLLGAAFKMVAEFMTLQPGPAAVAAPGAGGPGATAAGTTGGPGAGGITSAPLQALVNLLVAVIALLMATLAPLKLLRFAPVGATAGGGSGPPPPLPRKGGGGGGRPIGGFPESATDSQMSQAARSNPGVQGGGSDEAGGRNGWGLQPRGGLTERYAAESQARAGGGTSTDTDTGTATGTGTATETSTGSGAAGSGSPASPASTPTAAPSAGAGGSAAAGGGAAAGGAAAAAAGPVGLGLAALGGAARAAGSAASAAGDQAADHMDHGDDDDGGLHPRRT